MNGNDESGSRRARLLLIEDDPKEAEQIKEALSESSLRYDVACVDSPEAAIAGPHAEVELILLDVGVRGSCGQDVFAKCRERWLDTPIVVLSGLADEAVAQEAVRDGAQDYLVKGDINPRALCRALRYALERSRSSAEHRALRRELEQSRKLEAVGQLAAGIAHEINTPTQYVSDNTRFLKDAVDDILELVDGIRTLAEGPGPVSTADFKTLLERTDVEYLLNEMPRAVEQSIGGLEHIARIVRAMKEFSHPASEEKTPIDLNRAIETTVTVASNEWKYVADVETHLDEQLPVVPCLPGELNQVILNLIVNAAHAIGDGLESRQCAKGRITLRTRRRGDFVEILIEDTGIGIPEDHRERVFEPFFTTKEVGRGTGQGLAIAYDVVVNKHGGEITYQSSEGDGTTFVVQLPLSDEAAGKAA